MVENKNAIWGYAIVALVIGLAIGWFALPAETVEVVKTIDNTDYTLVTDLSSQLETKTTLVTDTETELANEKLSHADTLADLEALREMPLNTFNMKDWFVGLFEEAEDDAELEFNGTTYEGDDGEWDFRDFDAEKCEINPRDDDADELYVTCDDVELKTDDDDRITCDFEFEVDDMEYDDVEITHCILD